MSPRWRTWTRASNAVVAQSAKCRMKWASRAKSKHRTRARMVIRRAMLDASYEARMETSFEAHKKLKISINIWHSLSLRVTFSLYSLPSYIWIVASVIFYCLTLSLRCRNISGPSKTLPQSIKVWLKYMSMPSVDIFYTNFTIQTNAYLRSLSSFTE